MERCCTTKFSIVGSFEKGSEEIPRSEKVENAETKTRKMRMTGCNVTGFRWGDCRDSSSEKTPFVITPFSGPDCRRFRTGVGGRGLATNKPPKRAQKVL